MGRFLLFLYLIPGVVSVFAQQKTQPSNSQAPAQPPVQPARRDIRQFLGLGAAPDAAAAERGEKTYTSYCAFCHGAKANGAEGPDLVRSTLVLHDEKGELIGPLVHSGRPDRGMPAFSSLSESQLYDVAEFLHMRVELSANRGLYQVRNVVTGNAEDGKTFFNGNGNCHSCHSITGDLAHIGSKMQPADLQQAFLYPGARGFEPGTPKTVKVKVTTASGETISGRLKSMDDFHVSLFTESGAYRSFTRGAGVHVEVEDKLLEHRKLLDRYTDRDMHNLTAYLVTLK